MVTEDLGEAHDLCTNVIVPLTSLTLVGLSYLIWNVELTAICVYVKHQRLTGNSK